jgi:transcriptional regulator with XRE-family HTH domain
VSARHIMCDAMRSLRLFFIRALRLASPSVEQLAAGLGVSTSAVRRWRLGDRNVPPEAAATLAKLLRRQARELERVAAELDRFTDSEGGTNAE